MFNVYRVLSCLHHNYYTKKHCEGARSECRPSAVCKACAPSPCLFVQRRGHWFGNGRRSRYLEVILTVFCSVTSERHWVLWDSQCLRESGCWCSALFLCVSTDARVIAGSPQGCTASLVFQVHAGESSWVRNQNKQKGWRRKNVFKMYCCSFRSVVRQHSGDSHVGVCALFCHFRKSCALAAFADSLCYLPWAWPKWHW